MAKYHVTLSSKYYNVFEIEVPDDVSPFDAEEEVWQNPFAYTEVNSYGGDDFDEVEGSERVDE